MTLFNSLKAELESGKVNAQGKNLKITIICQLLKNPGYQETKENLCKSLSKSNPDKPHPYFMTRLTVFDVLVNRLGLVERIDKDFKLRGNFTPEQEAELKQLCKNRMELLKQ